MLLAHIAEELDQTLCIKAMKCESKVRFRVFIIAFSVNEFASC